VNPGALLCASGRAISLRERAAVIKLVWQLHRAANVSREELARRAVAEYAPLALASQPGGRAISVHLAEKPDARCDAVSFWSAEPEGEAKADPEAERRLAALSGELFTSAHGWLVDEVVHWDHLEEAPWSEPTAGVQVIAFVRRLPGSSSAEFEERYREHAELARVHHPGIARYVQSFVRGSATSAAPPLDAVAQLCFASREDFRDRFYRDDESIEIVFADVERFLDRSRTWSVLADERVLRRAPN
jgi:hypothetical protein